ncbi:MAG TPA: DUF3466 family protein [Longimicrobium sp.]|jgi:uncharacterized membrane protein
MKRFILALAAGVSLVACKDSPVESVNAAECAARSRLAPAMSLAGAPARSRQLESPRIVIEIPIRGVAVTNDAVVAGMDASGAATWSKATGVLRLTAMSVVRDYNAAGQAAGISGSKFVLLEKNGKVVEIGEGDGALGINSQGWVAGTQERAFFWTPCSGLKTLLPESTPDTNYISTATDINVRGDIVGHFTYTTREEPENAQQRAIVWTAWSDRWVGITRSHGEHNYANAINDRGAVVGSSGSWGSHRRYQDWVAFIWTAEGGVISIPRPADTDVAAATDINNLNEVVGSAHLLGYNRSHAWVWRKETGTELLPAMGQANSTATAINDWGDIIGTVDDQPVVWTWPENAHRWR